MAAPAESVQIEIHLTPAQLAEALREEALHGLTSMPKRLSPKWHYDELGSELFDRITRLPEYYPTRREREILESRAAAIAELTGAETLIELGSGFSEKTRLLLDALSASGTLQRFVPFDVSEEALRSAGEAIAAEYRGLSVHAIVGDFDHHLDLLPRGGRRLVAFLGGTIGNLFPDARARLLEALAAGFEPKDALLIGADLVKDRHRLELAYNDPGGVTAAFSRNVLAVVNRTLAADFELDLFRHDARWDARNEWIELGLVSLVAQRVHVAALDLTVQFTEGEKFHTEVSAKFRRPGLESELRAAGMELERFWTDAAGDFSLTLARRA